MNEELEKLTEKYKDSHPKHCAVIFALLGVDILGPLAVTKFAINAITCGKVLLEEAR